MDYSFNVLDKSLEISSSAPSLFTEAKPTQGREREHQSANQRPGLLVCLYSVFSTKL